ncbi:MAG: hypothetical protein ABIZ91_13890 [Gemmatimonadaceae bacterium]
MRFFEITTFRVRPGYESGFEAGVKAYAAAARKAGPNASWMKVAREGRISQDASSCAMLCIIMWMPPLLAAQVTRAATG